MNTLKKCITLCAALAVAALSPSCVGTGSMPDLSGIGKVVVPLASIGMNIAAARGDLPPGTVVTVAKTYAILTQPGSLESKIVPLAELGLQEAVDRGKIKPGEALIIQDGLTAIKEPEKPPVAVPVPTGSK